MKHILNNWCLIFNCFSPWFDYYGDDKLAIEGAKKLGNIKSIKQLEANSKSGIWPADSVIKNPTVVHLERRQINIGEW